MKRRDKIVELVEISKQLNEYLQNSKKKEHIREWLSRYSSYYNLFSKSLAVIYHSYKRGRIIYQNDLRYLINHFLVGYRIICSMRPEFIEVLYKTFHDIPLQRIGSFWRDLVSDLQFLYYQRFGEKPSGIDYRSMIDKILSGLPYEYLPNDLHKYYRHPYNHIMFFTSISLLGLLFSYISHHAILNNRTLDLMIAIEKLRNDRDKQFSWLSREIAEIYLSGRMFSTRSAYISVESYVGHGKTTYSLSSLDIFLSLIGFKNELGLEDEDLDIFRINDLETFHEILKISYKKNIRFPILLLDDSSDWLTPYWTWTKKRAVYEEVRDLLIYGRANVGVYIIVSNGPEDLSSFVRRLIEKRLTAIFFDVPETFVKASGFMLLSRDVRKSVDQFKHIEDIVDAFVYPLMKMPQKIYEEDMAHKREMIKRSVKRISTLKRSMVKT
ncbi:MAG: hypothetical protein GU359_04490 [Desulfurococcales archaeon]|nr:hypothetical protein [Desulfurococcales archaeon]